MNWKTTTAGIATVLLVILQAYHNLSSLGEPVTLAALLNAIGLILAKDASNRQ